MHWEQERVRDLVYCTRNVNAELEELNNKTSLCCGKTVLMM